MEEGRKKSVTSWSTFCSVNQHFKKLSFPSLRKVGRGSQLFWENVTSRPSGADILNMAVRRSQLKCSMVPRRSLCLLIHTPGQQGWAASHLQGSWNGALCPPAPQLLPPPRDVCPWRLYLVIWVMDVDSENIKMPSKFKDLILLNKT